MFAVRRRHLLAVAGAIAGLGIAAQSASASTITYRNYSPGWAAARTEAHFTYSTDVFGSGSQYAWIGLRYLQLYASPASSQNQVVTVTLQVWRSSSVYTAPWSSMGTSTRRYTIAPGGWNTVATGPGGGPAPWWFMTSISGVYMPQLIVTWRTTGGALLGSEVINYNAASDQLCMTAGCTTSNQGYGFTQYAGGSY